MTNVTPLPKRRCVYDYCPLPALSGRPQCGHHRHDDPADQGPPSPETLAMIARMREAAAARR